MSYDIRDALATPPALNWVVARVKSIDTVGRKLTLVIGDVGDPLAYTMSGASYLSAYKPQVGDVVHALIQNNIGILVLGSTSKTALEEVIINKTTQPAPPPGLDIWIDPDATPTRMNTADTPAESVPEEIPVAEDPPVSPPVSGGE